ncbi:uncharacterized protein LOC123866809 [Maniola jurtina]|uniref:uncharacterized protein LOC123866809 n=1 Tax=Maniola jurtina TaxID=191418 RepID=UPI001E687BB1|nr:uncharacterized protein LOC123866809 [Maniola jurtina]
MWKLAIYLFPYVVLQYHIRPSHGVIYTYEDVELRRIFASEFPQDTIRKSGALDPEHLGRYEELKNYYKNPKAKINSHFEELTCYNKEEGKMCRVDMDRYSPEEDQYYMSPNKESHIDRRRLLVLFLVSAVSAAPQNPQDVQILRYESNNAGLDSYNFVWETSDGSKHEEQGQLKNQGTENEGFEVRGEYGWIGPDGVTYLITYVADENGFKPQIQQGPGGAVPSAVIASLLG